jgi:hypothetical protein
VLRAKHTRFSSRFYRKSAGQVVVMKSSQLLRWRWQRFLFRLFYFVCFIANPSSASAEITQHYGRDFHRNAHLPGLDQSAFRQISPRRKKSALGEVFLWGHRADRKPAVKTLTNEASIEGRFRFAGKKPDL